MFKKINNIVRSYITSFINQLSLALNDQTTRNDHENGTNLNKKISGRDDPCDSGEVVATSTSKVSSTLITKIRDHISITIPIFS